MNIGLALVFCLLAGFYLEMVPIDRLVRSWQVVAVGAFLLGFLAL